MYYKNLNDIYDYKNKNKIKLQILCVFVYTDLTYSERVNIINNT